MIGKCSSKIVALVVGSMLLLADTHANAKQIGRPTGSSRDGTRQYPATPAPPETPALTPIPIVELTDLIHVDPSYPHAARAKVVGAFAVGKPAGTRLVGAWAFGFLPVTLSFSDGRCFVLSADYFGGALSNGQLKPTTCDTQKVTGQLPPSPPAGRPLRLIGSSFGYGAWSDDRQGVTLVTAPDTKTFQPLFTARMSTDAIMALDLPDFPGGDVTLVGTIDSRLVVLTLEVSH